jgi:nucleoside-diphosphate-sugar epimerase
VNISSGYHDFVFIDDFLDAFDTVFRFKHGGNFNTVNIGSGVQTSNYEVYESFARVFGYNIRTNFVDKMRSFDSNNWVCDPTLLREKYKYSVPTNFDVGVRKFIKDCERLGLYND